MANPDHLAILRETLDKQDIEIWNQWREDNLDIRAYLSRADLSGADLSGADLSGADLTDSDLSYANLSYANLSYANLSEANLSGAYLTDSDLSYANLNRADLREAYLSYATLIGADLRDTNLSGADLNETHLIQTRCSVTHFTDVNLSQVKGLETIQHDGPSYIDFHTLQKSGGKIPEIFLRGCGLSDTYIAYVRSLFATAIDYYSCFISYSHDEETSKFANLLHDRLQGKGIRCWLDAHEMIPGQKIDIQLDRGLRSTEKTILLCSEKSLKSWWVDQEIATSFEIERTMQQADPHDVRLIPINVDGFIFDDRCKSETTVTGGKLSQIRQRYIPDFTNWKDHDAFSASFDVLLRALKNQSV